MRGAQKFTDQPRNTFKKKRNFAICLFDQRLENVPFRELFGGPVLKIDAESKLQRHKEKCQKSILSSHKILSREEPKIENSGRVRKLRK